MTRPTFLPSRAVAERLGLPSPAAFLARRDRLEETLHFPLPMPHSQRPLLWKADEIEAWINSHGGPARPRIDQTDIDAGTVVLLDFARIA
ncbi:MAG: hypothetical protein V4712_15100 [Pseudomonadota bacterium]